MGGEVLITIFVEPFTVAASFNIQLRRGTFLKSYIKVTIWGKGDADSHGGVKPLSRLLQPFYGFNVGT